MNEPETSLMNTVIGSDDFSEILKSRAFIDKTNLICDVINSGYKVILVTAPRRFGKSTNINMLKLFLSVNINDIGEVIDKKLTSSYNLFTQKYNNKLLSIASRKDLQGNGMIESHLASYPVIYLCFKDVVGSKYENVLDHIRYSIQNLFSDHDYVMKNKAINELDIEIFKKYVSVSQELSLAYIINSVQFLSMLLYNHFKKRVYILIDEYDAPLNYAIRTNSSDLFNINTLINSILKAALKSNEYLEKGFLTGVSAIVRASAESGLNNVKHFMFLQNHVFSKYYGFTKDEVNELFQRFEINDDLKMKAVDWYDGYLVINTESLIIFNSWSIVNFIQSKKIENYWLESGSIDYIMDLFKLKEIKEKLELLLNDIPIQFELVQRLNYSEVQDLQTILNFKENEKIESRYFDLFFSYIFELGYLSYTCGKITFKIPNNEIKNEFKKIYDSIKLIE